MQFTHQNKSPLTHLCVCVLPDNSCPDLTFVADGACCRLDLSSCDDDRASIPIRADVKSDFLTKSNQEDSAKMDGSSGVCENPTEKGLSPGMQIRALQELLQTGAYEYCRDTSQNAEAGFIAGASNSDTMQSTYENIYNTTGTYVVEGESELSDYENSVVDEDDISDEMICIADAMNFMDDENEDSDVDLIM